MKRVDVVAKSNLSLPAKWLAVFMAHHENRNGEVITTPMEMRAWTGLDRTTLWDAIGLLEGAGFLRVIEPFKPGRKSSGRFAVTWTTATDIVDVINHMPTEIVDGINHIVSGGAAKAVEPRVRADLAPLFLSSPDVLSSPVLENKELTQESVSEIPAWLTNLRAAPTYDLNRDVETRLISRVTAGSFSAQRLVEASTALAAKWESIKWSPSNKRGYKRIDLTFFNWLSREGLNGHGKSQNGVSSNTAGERGAFGDADRYRRAAAEQAARDGR